MTALICIHPSAPFFKTADISIANHTKKSQFSTYDSGQYYTCPDIINMQYPNCLDKQ